MSPPPGGAIVSFQGITREVTRLDYEAYREMAERKIAEILLECVERHGLAAAAAEHRVGRVPLGESSVIVSVSAAHREEAFSGAREAIDRIKAEAPIWKREVEVSGDGESGRWVEGAAPPTPSATAARDLERAAASRRRRGGPNGRRGAKESTERYARAEAVVRMSPETARAVARGDSRKGDVVGTARLAGIQAAKRTDELIPLAHPLGLTYAASRCASTTRAGWSC